MARASRAKAATAAAAAAATTPTKAPPKKEETKDAKTSRDRHNALRRKLYKKARRAKQVEAVRAAARKAEGASDPAAAKKQLSSLRGQIYRQWKPRAGGSGADKVAELERLVRLQQEEIQALRRSLQAEGDVARLEPPASPDVEEEEEEEDPDSSPVKIREQLLNDVSQSPGGAGGEALEEPLATTVEVEEVVETTAGDDDEPEGMDGVEETTVATSIEKDVDYPTLPSVEMVVEEVQQTIEEDNNNSTTAAAAADESPEEPAAATATAMVVTSSAPTKNGTPSRTVLEASRDSSAEDSNAGTPRNIRRSPRKRAAKRGSLVGHSYGA